MYRGHYIICPASIRESFKLHTEKNTQYATEIYIIMNNLFSSIYRKKKKKIEIKNSQILYDSWFETRLDPEIVFFSYKSDMTMQYFTINSTMAYRPN